MTKQPEYPVFNGPQKSAPTRGSLTWLWITLGLGAVIGALFVIAPILKARSEEREAAAGDLQQQRDRADAEVCRDRHSTDPRCVAYRERVRAATVAAPVTCDAAGPRERIAWLDRPSSGRRDRATPRQLGFSIEDDAPGQCAVRLVTRSIARCDEHTTPDVFGDDPWVIEARGLGFSVLVCNDATTTSRWPIGEVLRR
jgi:hypothetical protein